jgi:hypothetical protein
MPPTLLFVWLLFQVKTADALPLQMLLLGGVSGISWNDIRHYAVDVFDSIWAVSLSNDAACGFDLICTISFSVLSVCRLPMSYRKGNGDGRGIIGGLYLPGLSVGRVFHD